MDNRFEKGILAGIVSGIIANVIDLLMGTMGVTTLRFVDWTGIVVLSHIPPYTLGQIIFSFISQIFFTAVIGVVFVYLLPLINGKNLFLKSCFFSLLIWFTVDAVTTMYKVAGTFPIPLKTGISNVISATIFGLGMARCLQMFEHADATSAAIPQPAMKPLDDSEDEGDKLP